MSLVTFAGEGPTLTVEAPRDPPRPQFNSSRMADNFSHPPSRLRAISSPCSFSTQARQRTATVRHFSGAGSFSEQHTADPLGRIYLFIFSSVFLKSSQTLTAPGLWHTAGARDGYNSKNHGGSFRLSNINRFEKFLQLFPLQ